MYLNKPSLLLVAAILMAMATVQAQGKPARSDDDSMSSSASANARYEVQQTIKFPRNSSKISADTQQHLREDMQSLATLLRYRPEASVEIAGYSEAGEKQPGILADARAQKVWEFLISLGLPAERMEPVGYGAPPGRPSSASVEIRIAAEDAVAMRQFVQPPPGAAAPELPPQMAVGPAPVEAAPPAAAGATTATTPPAPKPTAPTKAAASPAAPAASAPAAPPAAASEKKAQQREEARQKAEAAAAAKRERAQEQALAKAEQQAAAKLAREEAAERRKVAQAAALERAQAAAELRKKQQAEAAEKKAQAREEAKQRAAQLAEEKKQAAIRAAMAQPVVLPTPTLEDESKSIKGKKIQDNQFSSSYTRPLSAPTPKSALPGEGSYFIQGTAYFSANAATLTPGSAGVLDSMAHRLQKSMQGNPGLRVDVVGHADPLLEGAQAETLAQGRAEELVKELADRGVDRARLSAASAADHQPLTSKKDDPARGINMRAEIRISN